MAAALPTFTHLMIRLPLCSAHSSDDAVQCAFLQCHSAVQIPSMMCAVQQHLLPHSTRLQEGWGRVTAYVVAAYPALCSAQRCKDPQPCTMHSHEGCGVSQRTHATHLQEGCSRVSTYAVMAQLVQLIQQHNGVVHSRLTQTLHHTHGAGTGSVKDLLCVLLLASCTSPAVMPCTIGGTAQFQ
eukprot:1145757-Pelagomonas_calceolata.AAC.10